VLDIGKKLNANLKYIVYHGDEKTGHFHYAFDNYDNLGRSLFKKINNINDLSILQDIGFNHFSKLGMKRGQKKEITGVNNQNKEIFWQNKYNELKTQTNTQLEQLNSVNANLITTNTELVNANNQLSDINSNIAIKTTQLDSLDKNILDKIKVEEGYSKLLEDLKISIDEDKITIENLKSGVKDLKIQREQLTKDTSKSKEEKKLLYAEITTKQDELRILKDNIQSQIKYKKDLEKDLNSKIDIVINNSKTMIGLDKDKLREQIAKLVKHYLKFNTQLKEVDELKVQNEKLVNDNILLVEDISKKDKVISKLKEDNSNINAELSSLKKSELFLKNQLNELKISTQKQLNSLNDALGKIKDKMNKFKSFILFKGLDKDFKEYELNLQNEPDKNISLEVEHSSGHHSYFER
jgi:chromosome segregation ATPase